MNAAARLAHQSLLSRYILLPHLLNVRQIMILGLSFAILCSALSTIYVTYTTRILHATYQREVIEQTHLRLLQSQLLLERSTWMIPERIQHIAENELNMVIPTYQSTIIIHE